MTGVSEQRRLRGQTLFYADAVNVLRSIYPQNEYCYRDDRFRGELIIFRPTEILISVEIKSEVESKAVSTKKEGSTFKDLRKKIHSLNCLNGNGRAMGWLSFLAQCWDNLDTGLPSDVQASQFSTRNDILILPLDKESELCEALSGITSACTTCVAPTPKVIHRPSENISVLIYVHDELTRFFQQVQAMQ